MSRDLAPEEKATFQRFYNTGSSCTSCGNTDVTIRIWEKYGSTSKEVGGDISPEGIVSALVFCESCGHGQVVAREEILKAKEAA